MNPYVRKRSYDFINVIECSRVNDSALSPTAALITITTVLVEFLFKVFSGQ